LLPRRLTYRELVSVPKPWMASALHCGTAKRVSIYWSHAMRTLLRSNPIRVLAAISALALAAAAGRADEPPAGAKDSKLVGVWKLVSAKYGGKEQSIRDTHIKHVTPTHFIWVTHDAEGLISSALGGPYTLNGDKYEELPEYGVGPILQALKGKKQSFVWKVEGNKWYHSGKLNDRLEIEEVWERVEGK